MAELTAYIDSCIVSRVADLRISNSSATALARIASCGRLAFVTSDKTLQEILQASDPKRRAILQFILALLDKVQFRTLQLSGAIGGAPIGSLPIGGQWTDPLWLELQAIFDRDDAEHITQAVRANCDFFLTLDKSTILDRVKTNSAAVTNLCGRLRVVSPEELVDLLG
jgi:predicted nucleic acid-binding protein